VGGWIRPLNRHSDISLRAYVMGKSTDMQMELGGSKHMVSR
jgi:hypothetical protein